MAVHDDIYYASSKAKCSFSSLLQPLERLSRAAQEYGSALLMNLCLRRAGRAAAERCAPSLLRLCEALAGSDNEQVQAAGVYLPADQQWDSGVACMLAEGARWHRDMQLFPSLTVPA